jgi:enoyl-CoA hydratase
VLRGAGEKFFCAGANIAMLQTAEPRFKYYFCLHANETLNRLEQTPKVVIAAIERPLRRRRAGDRDGGGPADRARRTPGNRPAGDQRSACCPAPAARSAGAADRQVRAIELMITGRLISFEEARDLGILTDVLDVDDFDAAIHEYARQFCPPNKASKAAGRIKRAVQSGAEVPFESGLAIERELQQQLFESGDAREGLDAYIEKRKPAFTGR